MADILTDTLTAITNMKAEAKDAMDRLENIASLPYLSWFDFSQLAGFTPEGPGELTTIGEIPKLEMVATPGLETMDQSDLEKYRHHMWYGTNLDALQSLLMDWIQTGGVGISVDTQDALFNKARERNMQATQDRLDLAGARVGARGFRYANSMVRTLQNQALTDMDFKLADLNRDIVILMSDLAQKNVQFALEKDVAIENLHADFAIKFGDMFSTINRAVLDRFKIEQDARIAEFEGTLKAMDFDIQLQTKQATLDMEHQQRLLASWSTTASLLLERGKAQIQQSEEASRTKLTAATTLATVYTDSIKSLTGSAVSITTAKK